MQQILVKAASRQYPILIARNLGAQDAALHSVREVVENRRCLVITDSNVMELYVPQVQDLLGRAGAASVNVFTFAAGEGSKTLATYGKACEAAVKCGLDRSSLIVGIGGGVAGDLAGFVAATYMRGIGFLQVPTSLLAMVDSSVGGKTGVDLPQGKNLVGAFYQPDAVLVNLACLATLPVRELRCGLAEVVKYGVIMDLPFFELLETRADKLIGGEPKIFVDIVRRCCELKAQVVACDEQERSGRRAILNYGHTFGHAIEMLCDYTAISHGEAVAIGMGMAADLAVRQGLASADVARRQDALFGVLGIKTRLDHAGIRPEEVLTAMARDKKTVGNRLHLVLPSRIGDAQIVPDIEEKQLLNAIRGRCD